MKKIITFFLLLCSIYIQGQSKLEKLNSRLNISSNNEMRKIVKQESASMSLKKNESWVFEGFDCVSIIKDIKQNDNVYIINGEYSFKLKVFVDEKYLLSDLWTRKFEATAKEVLDDFIITEFTTKDDKK